MKEDFLFCEAMTGTTTAADVKAVVDSFFETNGLSWIHFKHICTDGAPAMIGIRSGFVTLVKTEWPHVTSSHCSLHRYSLASKTLPAPLMEAMDVAVKVINFIRARAKNHRLFQILADEMGAQHLGLLLYTKVRWLSRGKCLSRLYELRAEVKVFLQDNDTNLHEHFCDTDFLIKLAYLADLFSRLNEANLSLQGRDVTVADVHDKLMGLSARMDIWTSRMKSGSDSSFPILEEHLLMNDVELPVVMRDIIIRHLDTLAAEFRSYFDNSPLPVPWLKDPFNTKIDPSTEEAEELADFQVSSATKIVYKNMENFPDFWLSVHESYPILSRKASDILVQFATTYLCEAGFSNLVLIKTKSRSRLNVRSDIRLSSSITKPDIKRLVQKSQEQKSH